MNTRTFSNLAGLALALVVAMAVPSGARADLTIDMGTILSGGPFPSGDGSSSPYLIATIVNGTHGTDSGVYLTMSAPGPRFPRKR